MSAVATKKRPTEVPPEEHEDKPASGYKNVGLPVRIWNEMKSLADEEERSVNWMVGKAVREFLERRRQRPQ